MKTILVAVEQHERINALLETAYLTAVKFGSYIEGVAPRPVLTGFVGDASLVAMNEIEDPRVSEEEAKEDFERFMRERMPSAQGSGASYGWALTNQNSGNTLSETARVFDITMIGRPAFNGTSPLMSTVEPVLFESGRPIIIAPPEPPKSVGETVVIAWNRSTEAALATALAMPFIKRARRVVVMTMESNVAGPDGEQALQHLRRNQIEAELVHAHTNGRTQGEAVQAEAEALGCDLLIKGAYTQSRLRQMIFGGQTRHLMTNATMPVFLCH
jgi:nucleotide-binding universal stress UspA family protein